jgi:hypothetical protein
MTIDHNKVGQIAKAYIAAWNSGSASLGGGIEGALYRHPCNHWHQVVDTRTAAIPSARWGPADDASLGRERKLLTPGCVKTQKGRVQMGIVFPDPNRIRAVLRTLTTPFAIRRKIVLRVPPAPAFPHDQDP